MCQLESVFHHLCGHWAPRRRFLGAPCVRARRVRVWVGGPLTTTTTDPGVDPLNKPCRTTAPSCSGGPNADKGDEDGDDDDDDDDHDHDHDDHSAPLPASDTEERSGNHSFACSFYPCDHPSDRGAVTDYARLCAECARRIAAEEAFDEAGAPRAAASSTTALSDAATELPVRRMFRPFVGVSDEAWEAVVVARQATARERRMRGKGKRKRGEGEEVGGEEEDDGEEAVVMKRGKYSDYSMDESD
ncbi:hypothetical protein B0J12DRAFT_695096 [Macrophomina phaseolina]|uniref:Uncharacterized protein n=1 Tax=Macrophomina phaseolina TaxID=35725 RepID=A0ABQ8GTI5_9PEZI|nr:hypothetical protein B0J12DRAFT_695096 [Macrophomina phaseolina]